MRSLECLVVQLSAGKQKAELVKSGAVCDLGLASKPIKC